VDIILVRPLGVWKWGNPVDCLVGTQDAAPLRSKVSHNDKQEGRFTNRPYTIIR
jgi:hypothetical protein